VLARIATAAGHRLANSRLHPVVRAAVGRGILPRRGFRSAGIKEQPFRVKTPGGAEFLYMPMTPDVVAPHIYWGGLSGYEGEMIRRFAGFARKAAAFADLGANTGIFTLVALAENPDLVAHCFEPVAGVRKALEENLRINGFAATVHPEAVLDQEGTTIFSMSDSTPGIGHVRSEEEVGRWQHVEVATTTLDARLGNVEIDLLKVDVEGVEARTLDGARALLARSRPVIFLEVLPWRERDPQPLLDEFGYRYFAVGRDAVTPVTSFASGQAAGAENFICLPEGRHL
jgi:FkbM family methyltransferase